MGILTSILEAVNVLFGHPETAPLMPVVWTIFILVCIGICGPTLYWIWRPDKNAQLAKEVSHNSDETATVEPENPALAEALRFGHVGETVGCEIDKLDEESNPAFSYSVLLPRRMVLRWLDNNTVRATTRHRKPFYGEVIGRKHGELIIRREKGCPIRVRQPQS